MRVLLLEYVPLSKIVIDYDVDVRRSRMKYLFQGYILWSFRQIQGF